MKYLVMVLVLVVSSVFASTGPRGNPAPKPNPAKPKAYQSPYWYQNYWARTEFDPADESPR